MKTKNLSKVIMLGGAVVSMMSAAPVFADGNCDAATGGITTSTTLAAGAENGLVESPLTMYCSNNVYLGWAANATGTEVAVRAGSKKGMHTFGVSSRGGSVRACETTSLTAPHTTARTVTAGEDGCQ